MTSSRRRITSTAFAVLLAIGLATAGESRAAEYCFESPQPTGPQQYGSCKALLPFNLLGSFAGSLMKASQLPIPGAVQGMTGEILQDGQDAIFGTYFDIHTLFWAPTIFPLCSFKHPGENRFVGDKFVIDGMADFPLPWPIIPVFVQVNRHAGDIGASTLEAFLNNGGNLSNPGQLVGQGLIAPMAKIRAGVLFGVLPLSGTAKMNVNGHTISVEAKTFSFWPQVLEGEIPIEWIRFPGIAPNGYCPWPAANFIKVAMGGLNAWVDWAEITIESAPPVVLVPGDQTASPTAFAYSLPCRSIKFAKALAGNLPGGDILAEFAHSLVGYDLCATANRAAWSGMLEMISQDGRPVKTVDDMVQVPSQFNSDPAGWMMCDQAAGSTWTPMAPMKYYLDGTARSMGVGTIDLVAHSKGGLDTLHYMKGPWYADERSSFKLNIRKVATLGSPYKGSPLAGPWLTGRGGEPLPLGRRGATGNTDTAMTFWNTFWNSLLTNVARPENFQDPATVNLLTYIMDLGLDLGCQVLTGAAGAAVRVEQDPANESRLTQEMLGRPWAGPAPQWITFGANADSSGDDRLNETCTGFTAGVIDLLAGGGTRRENCVPADDDTSGGVAGFAYRLTYLVIGASGCQAWNAQTGACSTWSQFTHNDGAVTLESSSLAPQFEHTRLDMFTGHGGHSFGGATVGTNADHSQLMSDRAPTLWPLIKGKWGQNSPTTDYPQ